MILLDTNIVVAYLNGQEGIAKRIAEDLAEIFIPCEPQAHVGSSVIPTLTLT